MGEIQLGEMAVTAVGELSWCVHECDRRRSGRLGCRSGGDEQAVQDGCAGGASGDDDFVFE
jgi:hypothetical protein